MKAKLLRQIRQYAHDCAHINSITTTTTFRDEYISGVSIGYGISDNAPYKGIWQFDMEESTFDRLVRQKYWKLNKEDYYKKYRKAMEE